MGERLARCRDAADAAFSRFGCALAELAVSCAAGGGLSRRVPLLFRRSGRTVRRWQMPGEKVASQARFSEAVAMAWWSICCWKRFPIWTLRSTLTAPDAAEGSSPLGYVSLHHAP